MREKRRLSAAVLVLLVVFLPIQSASTLAITRVISAKAYGSDGVEGFYRPGQDERVTLNVVAKIDNENVTTDKVGIEYQGKNYVFNCCDDFCKIDSEPECVEIPSSVGVEEGTYNCTCIDNFDQPLKFKYVLLNDAGRVVHKSKVVRLVPDEKKPAVQIKGVSLRGNNLTVDFSAADYACDSADCQNECSGVKKVLLYDNGVLADEVDVGSRPCSFDSYITTDSISSTGNHNLCLVAYDRMARDGFDTLHVSEMSCSEEFLDFSSPEICPDNSFRIMAGSEEITHFATTGPLSEVTADVVFSVDEDNLTDVFVDAHSLNTNPLYSDEKYYNNYLHLPAACSKRQGTNECRVGNLKIRLAGAPPSIKVIARDLQGHESEKECSAGVSIDNDKPEAVFLGTDKCREGQCYIHKGSNTFVARIRESGAGMSNAFVYLDLSKLSPVYNGKKVQMYRCEQKNSEWECTGKASVSSQSEGEKKKIFIVYPSSDDAGNLLEGVRQAELVYDSEKPSFDRLVVLDTDTGDDFVKAGNSATFELYVNDSTSGVKEAVGDFSQIKPGSEPIRVECAEEESQYLCTFVVDNVAERQNARIRFNVTDYAGNTAVITQKVTIYEGAEEEKDWWYVSSVEASPSAISRQDMQLVSMRAFFKVELASVSAGDIEILKITDNGCSNQNAQDFTLPNGRKLFNNQRGSTTPIYRFQLKQVPDGIDPAIKDLNFECELGITTRVRNKVYPQQRLPVNLTIELKDYPFGQLPDNVYEEIRAIKENTLNRKAKLGGAILKLKKTLQYMEAGCTTYKTLTTIDNVAHSSGLVMNALATIFTPLEAAAKAVTGLAKGTDTTGKVFGKLLGYGCAVATCNLPQELFKDIKVTQGAGPGAKKIRAVPEEVGDFYTEVVYKDPRQSIYSSMATLCLPGIIYNLEKARQIECRYAACLRFKVPTGEQNPYLCNADRQLSWCVFIRQQNVNAIPGVEAFNYLIETVQKLLSNAANIGMTVYGGLCDIFYKPGTDTAQSRTAFHMCQIPNAIKSLNQVFQYLRNFKNYWTVPKDYCEQVFEGFE